MWKRICCCSGVLCTSPGHANTAATTVMSAATPHATGSRRFAAAGSGGGAARDCELGFASHGELELHVVRGLDALVGILGETGAHQRRRVPGDRRRIAWRRARRLGVHDRADQARLGLRPRTRAGRSPSRRARSRTPRGRCARRLPCPRAARATCNGRCRQRALGGERRATVGDCVSCATVTPVEDCPACRARLARARGRSPSAWRPPCVSITLPGLRSRWTMPARCARSSASAIWAAELQDLVRSAAARATAAPPASRPRPAPSPGSRSSPSRPTSNSVQMCGWLSAEIVRASRSKRARTSGFADQVLGQHLDRHVAAEPRVLGAVDLAHAARAERGDDFVGTEAGAGTQAHEPRTVSEASG